MIEQALEHLKNGNYAAAEVLYREMLADEPDNPEVLFMLSIVCQSQGDLDEPLDLLRRALRVQPRNPTLHNALGLLYLRRRDLDGAERSFFEAVGIDPNFAAAQNGIATVELSRGRFAAAEHALRKALKSEPDNPHCLLNMGVAMLEQGRADDAIGYLQQVASTDPKSFAAQLQLGRAFEAAGNTGFALPCFENALALNPASADALRRLADAELACGHPADAARHYQRLLDLGQESADVVANLARAMARLGRIREAEGAFLRALKLGGGEAVHLDFAQMLLDSGRPRDAIARLEAILEQAADRSRLTRILAEACLQANQPARAIELLRPLVSEGAPDSRVRMLLARALEAVGEKEAASAQVNRLLEEDPPAVDAVLYRAGSELAAGDVSAAIGRLRSVQRRHDLAHAQRQRAVRTLADALHASGEYQAAWEQYLGLDPTVAEVMAIRDETPLQLEVNEPAESAMRREVAWSWPPQPPNDGRPEPVFVFGWPGSGRSHVLRGLAGHAHVRVVDGGSGPQRERRLVVTHPQGAGPLGALSPAQVQLARRKYWKALQRQDRSAGEIPTVDAMWLTAEAIPTLYRLFPQAHLVIVRRDPKAMALAWLRSGYGQLEAMAAVYARQLDLLEQCRAGVPLNYVEVEAAKLAAEPDAALRNLVSSLSLPWNAGVEKAIGAEPLGHLAEVDAAEHYRPWLNPVFACF